MSGSDSPSMANRLIVPTFAVLVATDAVGAGLDIASGRTTWTSALGPKATLCAPLPMIAFQAGAVITMVKRRRRARRVAGALLAAASFVSILWGFFDGQLARKDLSAAEVGYQVWLLVVTGVVGGLGAADARRAVTE